MSSKKKKKKKKKAKGAKSAARSGVARKPGKASRGRATKVAPKKPKAKKASSAKKASAKRVPLKKRPTAKKPRAQVMTHPLFGRVTVDPREGVYWQKTLRLADRDVSVEMTVEDPAEATMELLDSAAQLVARLSHFDALARAGLRRSYDEDPDSAVALYVTHQLEELSPETLAGIFDKPKASIAVDDVLTRLLLKRVGSYPAKSGGSATFDYTIDADASQYVLAVQFDETGDVAGIAMES